MLVAQQFGADSSFVMRKDQDGHAGARKNGLANDGVRSQAVCAFPFSFLKKHLFFECFCKERNFAHCCKLRKNHSKLPGILS
jgi:hypothetical protein